MRAVAEQIAERDAELVLVGNGSTEEARRFLEETRTPLRLLVDPELKGYRAASLERRLLAPFSPRSWVMGLRSLLRGYRTGPLQGDRYQLGGLFVVTPAQAVEYAHVGRSIHDRLPVGEVLCVLERLGKEAEAEAASTG